MTCNTDLSRFRRHRCARGRARTPRPRATTSASWAPPRCIPSPPPWPSSSAAPASSRPQSREHRHRRRPQAVLQRRRRAAPGHRQCLAPHQADVKWTPAPRTASRTSSRSRVGYDGIVLARSKSTAPLEAHPPGRVSRARQADAGSGQPASADRQPEHHLEAGQPIAAGRRRSKCWALRPPPARAMRSPSWCLEAGCSTCLLDQDPEGCGRGPLQDASATPSVKMAPTSKPARTTT